MLGLCFSEPFPLFLRPLPLIPSGVRPIRARLFLLGCAVHLRLGSFCITGWLGSTMTTSNHLFWPSSMTQYEPSICRFGNFFCTRSSAILWLDFSDVILLTPMRLGLLPLFGRTRWKEPFRILARATTNPCFALKPYSLARSILVGCSTRTMGPPLRHAVLRSCIIARSGAYSGSFIFFPMLWYSSFTYFWYAIKSSSPLPGSRVSASYIPAFLAFGIGLLLKLAGL